MKILWAKADFLHPTITGGRIRTLGMLKRLHRRHEIHYVGLDLDPKSGAVERSSEYCTKAYPIPHQAALHSSPRFWLQTAEGMFSQLPVAVRRYRSAGMRRMIAALMEKEKFDAVVCDFLSVSPNMPDLAGVVLFQHNVESQIWKRRVNHTSFPPARIFVQSQYEKMLRYEAQVCRAVKRVIAVSEHDAQTMRSEYGVQCVQAVPTGVDVDYFTPPDDVQRAPSLVFVGSMDWAPNVDGFQWFVREVLPIIRARRPDCVLTIAGRRPHYSIRKSGEQDPSIRVTGTVPDVRPYLWEASVSIVPLRIGGGTRLKIFEAMAARLPVVSTTIGAEGLDLKHGETIRIADSPQDFAGHCLDLLDDAAAARSLADAAWEMVSACYSWEMASRQFERLLT